MNAPSRRMIGWAAVALVCALAGAAAWRASLPLLAGWAIRRAVEQATGMPATLGTVQLWVYGGELRLGELRVRHPRSGNVVAGWDGAHARLRFGPLLRSRIHIETLEVDRAFVALTSEEADSAGDAIPLSAFTGARPAGPALVDVELGRLEVRQARVLLRDAAGPARTIRVEDLTVTLRDLSTGSANAGRQTPLSLSARWEGARMEATGWVKPFAKSPEADVALRLADLDLARLGAWLSPPGGEPLSAAGRRITLRGGRAGATGRLTRGAAGRTEVAATLDVKDPAVALGEGGDQVSATSVRVALDRFDLEALSLRDGRIEAQDLEADARDLADVAGRVAAVRATLGSLDVRQPSARTVHVELTGLAMDRRSDGARLQGDTLRAAIEAIEVGRRSARGITVESVGLTFGGIGGAGAEGTIGTLRVTAEAVDGAARSTRGISIEGAGLAFRGMGGPGAQGTIGTLRVTAEGIDGAARSGRGLRLQAERLAGTGFGPRSLSVGVRSVRAAANGVASGGEALEEISFSLDGATVSSRTRPLASLETIRAGAAAVDLAARTGSGLRVEAEQVAVAELGPQGVSARLQGIRGAMASVDLGARAVRGASLGVDRLAAARAGEAAPFAVLRAASADVATVDLTAPMIDITRLEMDAPVVRVRRDAAGIDLARLGEAFGAAAGAPQAGAPAITPAAVAVGSAQIREGVLHFTDATVAPEASVDLRAITVNVLNVRPGSGSQATLVMAAQVGRGGSLQMGAQFTPGTFHNANGTARLEGVEVDTLRPYLKLPAPLTTLAGHVTADLEARSTESTAGKSAGGGGARPAWKIMGRAEGRDLAAHDGSGAAVAEIPSLEVREIEVGVPEFSVTVGEVTADRIKVSVERDADGAIRIAGIPVSSIPQSAIHTPQSPRGAAPPIRVRRIRATGTVPLIDRARPYPLETAITNLTVELADVSAAMDTPVRLDLRGQLEEMTFEAAGAVHPDPLRGQARLQMSSLDVVRWADYLPDIVRGRLADLRGAADLQVRFGPKLADLEVHGQVEASKLQLAEPEGDTVLSAELLTIPIKRLTLDPVDLQVGAMALEKPRLSLERRPDGQINLLRLLFVGKAPTGQGTGPAAKAAEIVRPVTIAIDRLTFRDGVVRLRDRHVPTGFSEQIRDLEGTIEGLSTEPARQATFALTGRMGDRAALMLKGKGIPNAARPVLEMEGRLSDYNLVGFSPYLQLLTSHRVQRGKIRIDLEYRLDGRRLDGRNLLQIDQLDVGEPAEWPDKFTDQVGVSLPMAISLLQDGDGMIDLVVPVTGDVARPEFDLGDAIQTAIQNAVVVTITAPLRLIGKIFEAAGRIDAIDIEPLVFAAGSARIEVAGQETIRRVVEFLRGAPRVRLQLAGYAEPSQDAPALVAAREARQEETGQGIVQRMARRLRLAVGTPPPPDLHALARRRAVAVQEGLREAGVEIERVFLAEPVVEEAAQARERRKPPQGRVEFRIIQ